MAAVKPEKDTKDDFERHLQLKLTDDVDVVALPVHGLHLGAAELRYTPSTLHEVLIELTLKL